MINVGYHWITQCRHRNTTSNIVQTRQSDVALKKTTAHTADSSVYYIQMLGVINTPDQIVLSIFTIIFLSVFNALWDERTD